MELTIMTGILVALCGVGVGVLSAMFGIGGGSVMVPLLHLAFGQPAAVSSGTSLFAILPTSLSGMFARLHDGTIKFTIGIPLGIAGACLSPLGAYAASTLPGVYAMVLTSCFVLFTAYNMFKKVWRTRPGAKKSNQAPDRAARLASAHGLQLYIPTVLLGALVGFISGYVGLGGGFIIVPVLQWAYGFTMKQSTGTSLVAVGILAVPSFITHALLGNIAWVLGLLLIAGSVMGARLGGMLVRHVNDRMLTLFFGVLMVAMGVFMAVQELCSL